MRRAVSLVVVAVVVLVALGAQSAAGASAARPRVTLFGDSVAAALQQARARKALAKGLDLRIDAKVCRRLAQEGCPYRGERPASVLSLVEQPAAALGEVVVIDVGYNDIPGEYGSDVDRVMKALVGRGVSTVIWVTMQERRTQYRTTNAAIRAAAARWPQIRVADWHDASRRRHGWFAGDGLHLTPAGAIGLARFLRPLVLSTFCGERCMRERRIDAAG